MFKKVVSLLLVGLLMNAIGSEYVFASSKAEKHTRLVEKVKSGIVKLGIGQNARIEVQLRDRTKLAGYISETGEDHFTITDDKTGVATAVAYHQVKQVKGNNLSTGAKVAIGAAIVLFVIYLILFNQD